MKLLLSIIICFLFSLSFSIQACKKKDCNKIFEKGTIYDGTTHIAVPNADVVLLANKSGCFSCYGGYVAKTTKTDTKGDYLMEFEGSKDFFYTIKVLKDKYYPSLEGGAKDECSPEKKKKTMRYITPEAYLKLHIKNVNPFDDGDWIKINTDYSDIFGNSLDRFYGINVDTLIYLRKNGNLINWQEKIYCPAFDTTYHQVSY
jgi:hypothetical protein